MLFLKRKVGSNQSVTTYVPKRSKKNLIKLLILLGLISSLYLNYRLLKANYVLNCSAGGMLMSKSTCDKLAIASFAQEELDRQQFVASNQDLFNNQ